MLEANRLFNLFPPSTRATLAGEGRMVELPSRTSLFHPERPARFVYFLSSGVASIVLNMRAGASAEVGMVGNEGMIGSAALLGVLPLQTECFMQMEGRGLRIPLAIMKRHFEEVSEVRDVVSASLQSEIIISAQVSACNKLHDAQARLARWLLMSSDRAQSQALPVTQEFLAQMLGTRRTTVTLVAAGLQRSGCINYSRGRLLIRDRAGLAQASCECYAATRGVIANLYPHGNLSLVPAA
jgi:CRP-like cAMP-binding protein